MVKPVTVSELRKVPPGNLFRGVFVLKKISTRVARTGASFFSLEFGDRTGTFSCTVFSDHTLAGALREAREGAVVRVEGVTELYQGRFSPKLEDFSTVDEAEVERNGWAEMLTEVSPENFDALCAELEEHIEAIPYEPLRRTTRAALADVGDVFKNSPAAISMHHAYRHGLLEHSCHLARVARALLPLYPQIDPSLAIAGALLHDIGKTVEYSQGLATHRTRAGTLNGHVVLGYRCVRKNGLKNKLAPDVLERLEHIILSHQGKLEWGAAALAATPEAIFISMIDNLDAKMGMVQAALRDTPSGEEFSVYFAGLESQVLVTPPAFPPAPAPKNSTAAGTDGKSVPATGTDGAQSASDDGGNGNGRAAGGGS